MEVLRELQRLGKIELIALFVIFVICLIYLFIINARHQQKMKHPKINKKKLEEINGRVEIFKNS